MILIPENVDQNLLKHLAASHIHITLFAKDLFGTEVGKPVKITNEKVICFLKECGCNFVTDKLPNETENAI